MFKEALFNIVAILHCRILISESFVRQLLVRKFDVLSPRVQSLENNYYYDYISYVLIHSFDLICSSKLRITTQYFKSEYLYFMKNRYPYVDGGIIILNKNVTSSTPFNDDVAWDEAEDIELSHKANSRGDLVDLAWDLTCISETKKYKLRPSILKKILIFIMRLLNVRN